MSRKKKQQEGLSSNINQDYEIMKSISENKQSYKDIQDLTSSKTKDQLKIFLISQAKNELRRVFKLTLWLDEVENNYINKVRDQMINDELSLKQYESVLTTIASLLTRANDIISKVLNDDSLTTILSTTIYNNEDNATTIVSQLSDPRSREKVRNILSQVIVKADNYIEVNNNEEE